MKPYILTKLRDWQAIKQAQALEHAGTPEGAAYLAESKRYGAAADEIARLREQVAHLSLFKPARRIETTQDPVKAIGPTNWEFYGTVETDEEFAERAGTQIEVQP